MVRDALAHRLQPGEQPSPVLLVVKRAVDLPLVGRVRVLLLAQDAVERVGHGCRRRSARQEVCAGSVSVSVSGSGSGSDSGSAFGARTRGRQACRAHGETEAGVRWQTESRVRGRGGARRGVRTRRGVPRSAGAERWRGDGGARCNSQVARSSWVSSPSVGSGRRSSKFIHFELKPSRAK